MTNKMSLKDYKKLKPESSHMNESIALFELVGSVVWRNNVGAGYFRNKPGQKERFVRFGQKGLPDIMGYRPYIVGTPENIMAYPPPNPIFWESKRANGRIRPDQTAFIKNAREGGCFAGIGTVDDLKAQMKDWGWL